MKLGLWGARLDRGGLGAQTHALARMLKPDKIFAIDSTPFAKGAIQDYGRYLGFNYSIVRGFPNNMDASRFLNGLTHVIVCETAYNANFFALAHQRRVKTYLQVNPEFSDHLVPYSRLALPSKFLLPSTWKMDEFTKRYGKAAVLLPPPVIRQDFHENVEVNTKPKGKRRFVHTVGRAAVNDRNGTLSLLEALKYTKADFELVIRSQFPLDIAFDDPRIRIDYEDHKNQADLYKDADALIMPRRYGGLCLPCNEALLSSLPVIMTDISPNNDILPPDWLVEAQVKDKFMTRIPVDIYEVNAKALAKKIEEFVDMSSSELVKQKSRAFEIGYDNFSVDKLKPKYEEVFK